MGAEVIVGVMLKIAAAVAMLLIGALGWSIRRILDNLSRQLTEIQAMTLAHKEALATGRQTFVDLTRRVERLEAHDEDRCKKCKLESIQGAPAHTPVPGRG